MKLTVYHDGQFWVGIVEVVEDGKLCAGRHVFGVEPKDSEILAFVNRIVLKLTETLSQDVLVISPARIKVSPKRLARQVSRELRNKGASTYAHDAIKLEHASRKKERQVLSRQYQEEQKQRRRKIARLKAKEKHRGR
ncbi:MAG: DUF2992 domain-containing protein [Sulfobacillus benefaciens]|uniref:DUF2992 domain-containing protein n=1 Tax=Sulfobacillus benefaciens TaxID=453960 RepID=A0A2T2XH69_9FIRM|nr:MAG: DUF2992 domain-containing protein [Sulfobacillus benefaciens]